MALPSWLESIPAVRYIKTSYYGREGLLLCSYYLTLAWCGGRSAYYCGTSRHMTTLWPVHKLMTRTSTLFSTYYGFLGCELGLVGYETSFSVVFLPINQTKRCNNLWYAVFARVICALFFFILAAEKSGCVRYADFFLWRSWSGFHSSIIENTVHLLIFYCNFVT